MIPALNQKPSLFMLLHGATFIKEDWKDSDGMHEFYLKCSVVIARLERKREFRAAFA